MTWFKLSDGSKDNISRYTCCVWWAEWSIQIGRMSGPLWSQIEVLPYEQMSLPPVECNVWPIIKWGDGNMEENPQYRPKKTKKTAMEHLKVGHQKHLFVFSLWKTVQELSSLFFFSLSAMFVYTELTFDLVSYCKISRLTSECLWVKFICVWFVVRTKSVYLWCLIAMRGVSLSLKNKHFLNLAAWTRYYKEVP